jgi:hypothetical protein
LLADRNQISFVRDWLLGNGCAEREWTALHSVPREPHSGMSRNFAPCTALA